jgi:hypothetical protein
MKPTRIGSIFVWLEPEKLCYQPVAHRWPASW